MVEMTLQGINQCPRSGQPMLLLKEKTGERLVPISTSQEDANIISEELSGIRTRRSEPYTLLVRIVNRLGGKLVAIVLHIAPEREVQSCLRVDGKEGPVQIEAHPVDALAIALRQSSPIFMTAKALESASFISHKGSSGSDGPSSPGKGQADMEKATRDGLPAVVREFLSTLDLSGLGTSA